MLVKFLATYRQIAGCKSCNVPAPHDVLALMGELARRWPAFADLIINEDGSVGFGGNRMPKRYIAEMFCDRVAACKVYLGDKYTDASAYDYYMKGTGKRVGPLIHPDTAAELEKMLLKLKEEGEEAAFEYVRNWLKEK